jgi:hypothetical protein
LLPIFPPNIFSAPKSRAARTAIAISETFALLSHETFARHCGRNFWGTVCTAGEFRSGSIAKKIQKVSVDLVVLDREKLEPIFASDVSLLLCWVPQKNELSLNATVVPIANNASATPNTMNLDISDPPSICPSAVTYEGRISRAL